MAHKTPFSAEQVEIRVWAFVVVMVTLVLVGIVGMLLYSVTFVTQPIKSMAPIDQAYTKMLNDIVLLIVGGIGGIMAKRSVKPQTPPDTSMPTTMPETMVSTPPPAPPAPTSVMPTWNWMGYQNPQLDESWTPGPPPQTSADYLHPEREQIAQERLAASQ